MEKSKKNQKIKKKITKKSKNPEKIKESPKNQNTYLSVADKYFS